MGLRSLTPPPSAHNRVVGGGVGAAALEQGHLGALPHTLQRQEVSARAGTASWEESAGCGRGGGGQSHPASPSQRPPLTQPREPQGGPREDGLPPRSRSPGEGLQVSICPTSQQAMLQPVGASQPLGWQGFTQHAGVGGPNHVGAVGPPAAAIGGSPVACSLHPSPLRLPLI